MNVRTQLFIWSVAIGFGSVATAGADAGADIDKLCPDAAREHTQLLLEHPAPKEPAAISNPALRLELLGMRDEDQFARQRLIREMKNGEGSPDTGAQVATSQVDASNLRRLKQIVTQNGFPSMDMVGAEGVEAAFLLVQHADTDAHFQEEMRESVTKLAQEGQIKGASYALLSDRVLIAQGRPQKYGSQFEERNGEWKPKPIADEAHVDERRHALGMISLANYTCQIRAVYGPAKLSK